jgi:uncharacterized protein
MAQQFYAFRLHPGSDLKAEIEKIVSHHQIKAGWIITCVGSLSRYHLRFANQPTGHSGEGHFEVVSLVGTLSMDGCRLHISISDHAGSTLGGHLLEGCIIYTTAEVVLGTDQQFIFDRELDPATGWRELNVKNSKFQIPNK